MKITNFDIDCLLDELDAAAVRESWKDIETSGLAYLFANHGHTYSKNELELVIARW